MKKRDFLEKARNKHGYKYNYPNLSDKITLTDQVQIELDGVVYNQNVSKHLSGRCPEKKIDKKTTEEFIKESKKVWGEKYDYSLTQYTGALNNIKIVYNGVVYEQRPTSHLEGKAPEFRQNEESIILDKITQLDLVGKKEIQDFLNKWNVEYIENWNGFSFYLPKYIICIDFLGRHYFEPISELGGVKTFDKFKELDKKKEIFSEENFINLIKIRYDQIDDVFRILWDSLKSFIQ